MPPVNLREQANVLTCGKPHSRSFHGHLPSVSGAQLPEPAEPVKGEEIRVMIVVCPTLSILECGSARGDDILALEEPVYILKTVVLYVGMLQ